MSITILVVEETPTLQGAFEVVLGGAGYVVIGADSAATALSLFRQYAPRVVLLDLMMAGKDGLDLMAECLEIDPSARIIVLTPGGGIARAVTAMRAGAYDFLLKPFDGQRLLNTVANALLETPSPPLSLTARPPDQPPGLGDMIGNSDAMLAVFAKVRAAARSMATVFISGESGTGKELCAQAVHAWSNRANGPFVPLDCGAIPQDMLESEVFGHLKGSFTGAIATKQGAAAAADGGTLFLDEICEIDLQMQAKLLRFLQTSTIQPLGAPRPHKVNTRIICATNRDPLHEVKSGRFREDLFYRLHVVPIRMPALRDRGRDAVLIAAHALNRISWQEGKTFNGLAFEVENILTQLKWPGNVRQLLNTLQNAVVLHDGPLVTLDMLHLGDNVMLSQTESPPKPPQVNQAGSLNYLAKMTLAQIEQLVIEHRIEQEGGSVPRAAASLGLAPSTLYRKREAWLRDGDESVKPMAAIPARSAP